MRHGPYAPGPRRSGDRGCVSTTQQRLQFEGSSDLERLLNGRCETQTSGLGPRGASGGLPSQFGRGGCGEQRRSETPVTGVVCLMTQRPQDGTG
jgi:hypothetical protein